MIYLLLVFNHDYIDIVTLLF